MAKRNQRWRATGLAIREIIGWLLIVVSLGIFWSGYTFLKDGGVIEGLLHSVVGVMLFRGGLQLVKVAVAAKALRPTPVDVA